MPIRINLLAEAQALEEMRRKDPVKRAAWIGGLLVLLMLAWSSSLQLKMLIAKGELSRVEGQLAARSNEFRSVLEQQQRLTEVRTKLAALQRLATNRILYGTLLNAFQQTVIEDVQLVRLRTDQEYFVTEATKPKTNGTRVIAGMPATSTERFLISLDAKDNGPTPGDQVNKYKQSLASSPYFEHWLGKTNEIRLASLSPPQSTPDSRPFVMFSLECRFPEKTR